MSRTTDDTESMTEMTEEEWTSYMAHEEEYVDVSLNGK